jgi:hypothetical protein
MILHCVYCAIREDVPRGDVASVMGELADLRSKVEGMTGFAWGPNRDFESKSGAYSYGFVASFADRAALSAYDAHPAHRAAAARLVSICRGAAGGITVFDIDTRGK